MAAGKAVALFLNEETKAVTSQLLNKRSSRRMGKKEAGERTMSRERRR